MISITEFFRKKGNLPRNNRCSQQAGGRRQEKNDAVVRRRPSLWAAGRLGSVPTHAAESNKTKRTGCHSMRLSRITGWDRAPSPASSAHRPRPETALRRDDDCFESLTLQKYLLGVTLSDKYRRACVKTAALLHPSLLRRGVCNDEHPFFRNFASFSHRLHYTIRFT